MLYKYVQDNSPRKSTNAMATTNNRNQEKNNSRVMQ